MPLRSFDVSSPLGELRAVLRGEALCALDFAEYAPRLERRLAARFGSVPRTRQQGDAALEGRLRDYFAGELHALDDLTLDPGGTPFQRAVWSALRRVPAGGTASYGALAAAIGRPGAARAVGAACGRNPLALLVPCHRALGADGSWTGYAGGRWRKAWLLRHEGVTLPRGAGKAAAAARPLSA